MVSRFVEHVESTGLKKKEIPHYCGSLRNDPTGMERTMFGERLKGKGEFNIGFFVIAAGVLIIVAIVVFGSGLSSGEKVCFETYFDGSVSGLTVGAPVELRGVRIGQVEKIGFIPDEYKLSVQVSEIPKYEHYVMVLCSVLGKSLPSISNEQGRTRLEAMVSRGLRVRLSPSLLTGQAHLEADYVDDPERFKAIAPPWIPRHSHIPSAPAVLTTLRDSVDRVLFTLQELEIDRLVATVESMLASLETAIADARIGEVSTDLRTLLTDASKQVNDLNAKEISLTTRQTLASADRAVTDANVPALSRDLRSLIAEVRQTNVNLRALLVSPEPVAGPVNLPEMVARLNTTLGRLDRLISTERPQIEIILTNFKEISDDMKDLIESLKQRPSDLFSSKPPPKSEAFK